MGGGVTALKKKVTQFFVGKRPLGKIPPNTVHQASPFVSKQERRTPAQNARRSSI